MRMCNLKIYFFRDKFIISAPSKGVGLKAWVQNAMPHGD